MAPAPITSRARAAASTASKASVPVLNMRGLVDRVNRGTEATLGYERAQIVGKPLCTILPERIVSVS
jgi:hypothetical protein